MASVEGKNPATYGEHVGSHPCDIPRVVVNPSLGSETMCIVAKYALVAVDDPAIDTYDSIFGDEVPVEVYAALGRLTLEYESSAGMNS